MIADRIEQPEPAVDPPGTDVLAQLIELRSENAALRARLAEIETPVWLALKPAAARANILYESMRRLAERGGVVAKKDCGRIFIDQKSLDQYIERRRSQ
jgi:hypothetical protein